MDETYVCVPASKYRKTRTVVVGRGFHKRCALVIGTNQKRVESCMNSISEGDMFVSPPRYIAITKETIDRNAGINDTIKKILKIINYMSGDCNSIVIFVAGCMLYKRLVKKLQVLQTHSKVYIEKIELCPNIKCKTQQTDKKTNSTNSGLLGKLKKFFGGS